MATASKIYSTDTVERITLINGKEVERTSEPRLTPTGEVQLNMSMTEARLLRTLLAAQRTDDLYSAAFQAGLSLRQALDQLGIERVPTLGTVHFTGKEQW
jgi:hypothetical protein